MKVTYIGFLGLKSESMIQSLISNSKYILICSIFEYETPSIDFWHFVAHGISFMRLFRKIKLWEVWKPHPSNIMC